LVTKGKNVFVHRQFLRCLRLFAAKNQRPYFSSLR
jgi:hypothetical protein